MRQILFGSPTTAYGASDSSATTNTATNTDNLADGALGVFDQDFTYISSAATKTYGQTQTIYLAQGVAAGKNPRVSMPINGSLVSVWKGKSYTAPTAQVYVAGYIGSGTDSINFIDGTEYSAKIQNLTKGVPVFPNHTSTIKFTTGQTPVSVVSAIAGELNRSVLAAPANSPERFALTEVLSDVATATDIVQTATLVNGTTTITFSAAPGALAAGNWLRIGTNANTTAIYKVKSVVGAVVELYNPYVTTSVAIGATISQATLTTHFGATNPTTASLAGLRTTVFGAETYAYGDQNLNKTMFLALGGSFIGTPVTLATSYSEGSGTYYQVQKIENETIGYYDHINRVELPYPADFYASSALTYDLYNLVFGTAPADKSAQGNARFEKLELIIALPPAATQQADFETVINAWMASVPGAFAAVNL